MKAIKVRPTGLRATRRGRREPNRFHLPYHDRNPTWATRHNSQPVNRRTLLGIFCVLHGYASHSPPVVMRKWRVAERRFLDRHAPILPYGRCSARFHDNFTAGAWL